MFSGTIVSCDPETSFHSLKYDDGEEEDVVLPDKSIRFEGTRAKTQAEIQAADRTNKAQVE